MKLGEYMEIRGARPKKLVIGCGTTPRDVLMGTMRGTDCSLGSDHHNDFTVDISAAARPNVVMDILEHEGSKLVEEGGGKFDTVTFEYLNRGPRQPFSQSEIAKMIDGADVMLQPKGKIEFYNGSKLYREHARTAMEARGYSVKEVETQPSAEHRQGHASIEGERRTRLESAWAWLTGKDSS